MNIGKSNQEIGLRANRTLTRNNRVMRNVQ